MSKPQNRPGDSANAIDMLGSLFPELEKIMEFWSNSRAENFAEDLYPFDHQVGEEVILDDENYKIETRMPATSVLSSRGGVYRAKGSDGRDRFVYEDQIE